MRIAVIDCGTNTFNLLVAEAGPDGWQTEFDNKIPVKLGAGGFETHEIRLSRFARGIDALFCHRQNISNFSCNIVHAYATSAIREASNGSEFLKKAKEVTGIEIETIDGDREAYFIYKGISQTMTLDENPVLMMDIGGGSIEFIIANNTGILWKKSFLLGVSRLHEKIKPADRLTHEDVNSLRYILNEDLKELRAALETFNPKILVGSSGSFDTLHSLFLTGNRKEKISRSGLLNEIPLTALPSIHSWLVGSTLEERLKHPAIPSIRAEYMPLASYLVKYVLELCPVEKFFHSANSLREGAMAEIVSAIDWSSVEPKKERAVPDGD